MLRYSDNSTLERSSDNPLRDNGTLMGFTMTHGIDSIGTPRALFLVLIVMNTGYGCVLSIGCYTNWSCVFLSWPVYFTIFVFRIVLSNIVNWYINRWLKVSAPFPRFFFYALPLVLNIVFPYATVSF